MGVTTSKSCCSSGSATAVVTKHAASHQITTRTSNGVSTASGGASCMSSFLHHPLQNRDEYCRPCTKHPMECPSMSGFTGGGAVPEEPGDLSLSDQAAGDDEAAVAAVGGGSNNLRCCWEQSDSGPSVVTAGGPTTTAIRLEVVAVSPSDVLEEFRGNDNDPTTVASEFIAVHDCFEPTTPKSKGTHLGSDAANTFSPRRNVSATATPPEAAAATGDRNIADSSSFDSCDPSLFHATAAAAVSRVSTLTPQGGEYTATATTPLLMMSDSELSRQISAMMPWLRANAQDGDNVEKQGDVDAT